jgi:PAS domain S-box-containing protein
VSFVFKLALLCALAVLPAAGIQVWGELELRRTRTAEVEAEAARAAAHAASEIERLLGGTRQFLGALAAAPTVKARNEAECRPYIAELEHRFPEYGRISVADRVGRLFCAAAEMPAGFAVADLPFFREALRTGEFTVGEYQVGRLTGRPLLTVALPEHGPDGEVTHVAIAALDLRWLSARLQERGLPPGGSVTVADRGGTIVARAPMGDRFLGTRIPESFIHLLNAPAPGAVTVTSQDGTRRVLGYVPLGHGPRGVYVSAGLSTEAAFALLDRSARMGFLLIAAGIASAVLAALLAGRLMLGAPVARLLGVTERWRQGDMAARVGRIGGGRELTRLGAGFDAMADALEARSAALAESEARLRLAQEAGGIGSWAWDVRTNGLHWSESCHRLHGTDPAVPPSMDAWRAGIHPEDRAAMEEALARLLRGGGTAWAVEYRFTRPSDGEVRWMAGRGNVLHDPASGAPLRMMGIVLDFTERRATEERQTLLMREVDHRAKNALAVVQTMLRLTRAEDVPGFVRAVEGRVAALARAQTLLAEGRWRGADLRALIKGEIAPFVAGQRADLDGPAVVLPPGMAQPLAMTVHELATNAAKHGALSVAEGRIVVRWSLVPGSPAILRLRWEETGGPGAAPPTRRGFGSRVLENTVQSQLGGTLSLDWRDTGLVCGIEVPLRRAPSWLHQADIAAE